jgi:CubicO group peptidase (beta-lactamase class C family)
VEVSALIATTTRSSSAPEIDAAGLSARIDALLNRRPAVGLAFGVIRDGELVYFRGHGVANVATQAPVTDDTLFRIASITKTFTAIAVMQLWERGLVDLDAPANDYLKAFQLVRARRDFRPATLRHLLTHTSGIPEMVHPVHSLGYIYGESYALDERVPTLAEYYAGGLKLTTDPGTVFRYTDHNFAVLWQIVEDVSGEPLDRYLKEHVFEPLGMASTDINRTELVTSRLATGYTFGARGPKPVIDRRWLTAAASMIY